MRFLAALSIGVPGLASAGPHVLLVGSYHNKAGQFDTIQAAVNAAAPGDWILIRPGDYHEQSASNAGVLITTPNLHVRGMQRRTSRPRNISKSKA